MSTDGDKSEWTVLKILEWTTGFFGEKEIDSPRVDAEILLADVLGMERIELYANYNRPLVDEERKAYRALVKRRAAREPAAYILEKKPFWEFDLRVTPEVLIPRPETETLIRTALERIDDDSEQRLVDVGTGSGAVALSIAWERSELRIAATDVDADALDIARENAENLGFGDRIEFFEGDLLEGLSADFRPVDIVVSNPPYVTEDEYDQLQPEIREYEPRGALVAGEDGLDVIRRLIPAASDVLSEGGWLLFEIGHLQGDACRELLEDEGYDDVDIVEDYGGRDRVAMGRNAE